MRVLHRWIPLCLLALAAAPALAQSRPVTPKPGSPDRKAICDTLRGLVEKELKQPVVFKIDRLKVQNGWAFLLGVPKQPNGKGIDYRRTPHREAFEAGAFGDDVMALFRKRGGRWHVVTHIVGATDVAYEGWDRKYGAPGALFK